MSTQTHVFVSEYNALQLTKDPTYEDRVVGGQVARIRKAQQPINFENGRYTTTDQKEAEWMRNHRLCGTYFRELPDEVIDQATGEGGKKKVADSDAPDINELSIPEAKAYIEDHDLSDAQIVSLTEGDQDDRTGINKIRTAAQKRLEASDEVVVKEGITNINQLKDYVEAQPNVDGRALTTPEKVIAAAKQLTPPHSFPNIDVSG